MSVVNIGRHIKSGLGYGPAAEQNPLKVAMAAADRTVTQPFPDPSTEQRLSILDLESRIIEAQNAKVLLRTEYMKVEDRERELQTELAKRVQSLGLKVEVPK